MARALPAVRVPEAFHVGAMNPAGKGSRSCEGHGLSVTSDPDAWTRIARLGGLPRWKLNCAPGRGFFADAHALGPEGRAAVAAWGIREGYVVAAVRWAASRYDSELDCELQTLHSSEEEARLEAGDGAEPGRRDGLAATAKLADALHPVKPDVLDPADHLLAVHVETQCPHLDGVWWDDKPGPWSAPRGVILPGRLGAWTASRAS